MGVNKDTVVSRVNRVYPEYVAKEVRMRNDENRPFNQKLIFGAIVVVCVASLWLLNPMSGWDSAPKTTSEMEELESRFGQYEPEGERAQRVSASAATAPS